MHILIFSSLYPSQSSPHCGLFVQQQVRALAQAHRITVIAPELVRISEWRKRHTVSEMEETWRVHRPRYWYVAGIWWIFYLFASVSCARQIDWTSVDLVHSHNAIPAGFVAAWLSRYYRKPFVLTEHTGRFASWVAPRARRLTVQWTMSQARRIIVVSRALRRSIELEGITGEFSIVPNVVDGKMFYPLQAEAHTPSVLHLLWVGSFGLEHYLNKGVIELLRAIAIVRMQSKRAVYLTLIGGGAAKSECESLAQQFGIADLCNFVGQLTHAQVRDWIQKCDVLVLASHVESFGVVLIEAMACGKPVIATRCGGPEDIVTPDSGILVEPNNPEALADSIIHMAEDYESFDPKRISAYARGRFGPEPIAHLLTQVYTEVCAG